MTKKVWTEIERSPKTLKPIKFSRCSRCQYALQPKVIQSGMSKGRAALGCLKYRDCGARLVYHFAPAVLAKFLFKMRGMISPTR